MDKYEELPDAWSQLIHEASKVQPLEALVFIEQADGSLREFGPGAPDLGRRAKHCVIVRSIGTKPSGEHYGR